MGACWPPLSKCQHTVGPRNTHLGSEESYNSIPFHNSCIDEPSHVHLNLVTCEHAHTHTHTQAHAHISFSSEIGCCFGFCPRSGHEMEPVRSNLRHCQEYFLDALWGVGSEDRAVQGPQSLSSHLRSPDGERGLPRATQMVRNEPASESGPASSYQPAPSP